MKKQLKKIDCFLVNGCSWTYGSELIDSSQNKIINHFDPVHEHYRVQHSWPTLLSTNFGIPAYNHSTPGGGNDRILRTTQREVLSLLAQGIRPFVIIAWSQLHRFELPSGETATIWDPYVSPNDDNAPLAVKEIWGKHSSDHTDVERWLVQLISMDSFLRSVDVDYLSTTVFTNTYNIFEKITENKYFDHYLYYLKNKMILSDHLLHYSFETFLKQQAGVDYGPGGHPLASGHALIANNLRRHLLNTFQFQ